MGEPEAYHLLPTLNAMLNGVSALFLVAGYMLIRKRIFRGHAIAMVLAVLASTAFLSSYVGYHLLAGAQSQRFPPGPIRPIYLAVLLTHTVLATAVLPLAAITLWQAARRQWTRHHRIARLTLPVWLYVSVTGVVIYWMLYHLAPTLRG